MPPRPPLLLPWEVTPILTTHQSLESTWSPSSPTTTTFPPPTVLPPLAQRITTWTWCTTPFSAKEATAPWSRPCHLTLPWTMLGCCPTPMSSQFPPFTRLPRRWADRKSRRWWAKMGSRGPEVAPLPGKRNRQLVFAKHNEALSRSLHIQ